MAIRQLCPWLKRVYAQRGTDIKHQKHQGPSCQYIQVLVHTDVNP